MVTNLATLHKQMQWFDHLLKQIFINLKIYPRKKKHILYNLHIMAWTELNYVLSEK